MTKKELLEAIKDFPDDSRIIVQDRDGEYCLLVDITSEMWVMYRYKGRESICIDSAEWWDKWGSSHAPSRELVDRFTAIKFR